MSDERNMLLSTQNRGSRLRNLLLFVAGVATSIVLLAAAADIRFLTLAVLLTAGVWTVAWMDLGFLLGGFLFWFAMIVATQATIEPGQVDNFLPGLAVPFGWVPYVVVFAPVFMVMKLIRSLFKPSPGLGPKVALGSSLQGETAQPQQS
jgi:hypothetical protein